MMPYGQIVWSQALSRSVQLLILCVALSACQNSSTVAAPVDEGGGTAVSVEPEVCSIAESDRPLSPAQRVEMIRVRQKVFGPERVDPETGALPTDKIIVSWIAVTAYAVSLNGHVVMFDAFIGDTSGYVPINDCELSDMRAEAVFIGHGHNGHSRLLPTVTNRNRGIRVIASEEVCIDLALAMNGVADTNCHVVIPAGAPLGSQATISELFPGIDLSVIRVNHSESQFPQNPGDPSLIIPVPVYPKPAAAGPCFGGPTDVEGDFPENGVTCPQLTSPHSVPFSYSQDGTVTVLYQFQMAHDLNLTWFSSVGPVEADGDMVRAMQALPQTDIQLGAILGLNGVGNGFLDVRLATEALRSRLSIPGHHDFFPKIRGRTFEAAYFQEIEKQPASSRPGIIYMSDPEHYLLPDRLTWNSDDPIWAETEPLAGLPPSSAITAP